MKIRYKFYSMAFLLFLLASTQFPAFGNADSLHIFSLEAFYNQILKYHPVAKQAELLTERAQKEIRIARGSLDPTLNSKFSEKQFSETPYYTQWDSYLNVPLWYGMDIQAGFQKNSGEYLSRQYKTPEEGLSYIGLKLPIGQGLLIDERRTAIRQAQLMQEMAEAEKVSTINKLLLEATKDYWNWMFAYYQYQLYDEGHRLAVTRYEAVKKRAINGDLATIDTVEAKIEVQNRAVMKQQAKAEHQNTMLLLSNHLWFVDNTPVEITENARPFFPEPDNMLVSPDSLYSLVKSAEMNHPDIQKISLKQQSLELDRRYLADKLKPKLDLEYKFLDRGFMAGDAEISQNYITNNYSLGVSFSMPLFLRAERGKLQMNKIKSTENALYMQQSSREIINQIHAYYNDLQSLNLQAIQQEDMVNNTALLRDAEQQLFEAGESSFFLVNTREVKLISSRVKYYELLTKYFKTQTQLQWAAGRIQVGN